MRNRGSDRVHVSRRDVLAALVPGGLAIGLLSRPADARLRNPSATQATGTVFEDAGGSRARGISGVLVSNGRDVVRTDDRGRWSLPVGHGDNIFVIKPAQWRVLSSANSQQPFWRSCAVRDGSPHTIDFALSRCEEPERFDVLLVADTQAANREELGFVRHDLLAASRSQPFAFALHHGDVMGDDLSLLPDHLSILEETGLAWHHCPGNHDMDLSAPSTSLALRAWQRHVGPPYYAFEYGKTLFILLNTVEPVIGKDRHKGDRPYRGRIGADQLRFVRNVLDATPQDRLVSVSMHVPLASFSDPVGTSSIVADRGQLLALLAGRQHTISFAGHSHTTEHHYFGPGHGFGRNCPHHHHVLTAVCGSWWSGERGVSGVPVADSRDGSPRGHHILSVDGVNAAVRFVPAHGAASQQMRVMVCGAGASGPVPIERALAPAELSEVRLMADVFDGGPNTEVAFEIASGDCREGVAVSQSARRTTGRMSPVGEIDAYVAASYSRAPHLCKPWLTACPSSHIWQAALPAHLAPGIHAVTVSARLDNGQTHSGHLAISVAC